ncbi:MAG TPA: D-xylose transporter XylE [Porphyromonadaceae bacterium]|jgi:SP family xylose:H+ symportor-like MFS transporter|uniref:D-xylose transporter XylE n=1 Tax=Limibacterium fermenti TaxID=3229863 RepID=UPI000E871262|nr:D-xylose transporter XylE [Porphyromonadaceae bacterium]HBL33416.1 D-xylose transporter XylE [Porphyromonadaceae bacterium]HBX46517.1 D-xylose transporter XylE [Porphyromonadaceae bacterium]
MGKEYNSRFILSITFVATLGGLLFGYDTAVISGAEKSIQAYFIEPLGLSSLVHGATVSSALLGCIIGGCISGIFSNRLGRKKTLMIASALFLIAALGAGYPETFFFKRGEPSLALLLTFNLYRIVGGIGVGLVSAVTPTYIGEIAPSQIRGRLVSFNQLAIILGMLVVYFVNWGIAKGESIEWINAIGWRRMLASCAIPASLFGILLFFIPESPRFLCLNHQENKALSILVKINGTKQRASDILQEIRNTLVAQTNTRLFSYGKKVIIIGIFISVFQQFVGINVVLYYAPRIFESMGAVKDASMLQTIIMGIVNVLFTLIAIFTVDKVGRKPLLISGSVGMAIGMFALSAMSHYGVISLWTLLFIIIFTASFMMSWGPICWVLISEIFPNKIRSKAVAIAVAAQWIANYLISSTYPALMDFSGTLTYGFYGMMAVLSGLFVWKWIPETKGKSLEEMEKLW